MRKFFALVALLGFTSVVCGQGFTLKMNSSGVTFDSIYLQRFDGHRDFQNILSAPFRSQTTLKQKKTLPEGYYQVSGDDQYLFPLLISNEKEENFTVTLRAKGEVFFENNDENNQHLAFERQIAQYEQEIDSIENIYIQASHTLPQNMLRTLADSLMMKEKVILENADAYKLRIAAENKGKLLSNIAKFSRRIKSPSQYVQSQKYIFQYYTQHLFDYYSFDDPRMAFYPKVSDKILEFSKIILQMQAPDDTLAIQQLLHKAQQSPEIYTVFFDKIEKIFGTLSSPLWNEEIYLCMLNNALQYEKLPAERQARYKSLYAIHQKNREGSLVPDFQILWADSTKSSLYDIESEYLILYFQNPDCPSCTELREKIALNEDLNRAIDEGKIKLVTIYFETDEALWKRYLQNKANPRYMHGWDFQHTIEEQQLYDLRVIPYLFLLDKDKRVIKKDLPGDEISDYLRRLNLL
ncbi:MAG: DUF5106 domain-containing protein [Bacteroidales bacterium]|nr:DUF5106 domain-containing protein [Bacteroidales bacterium]